MHILSIRNALNRKYSEKLYNPGIRKTGKYIWIVGQVIINILKCLKCLSTRKALNTKVGVMPFFFVKLGVGCV